MEGESMLNEEQIRLMTKMAAYEEGEGKEYMPIKQYYRKDYVSCKMISTFISSTIAFGILFLLWLLYSMEQLAQALVSMNLITFGSLVLVSYLVFTIIYQIIAVSVYSKKYQIATQQTKLYHSRLKKVMKLQERNEKSQPAEDWE